MRKTEKHELLLGSSAVLSGPAEKRLLSARVRFPQIINNAAWSYRDMPADTGPAASGHMETICFIKGFPAAVRPGF